MAQITPGSTTRQEVLQQFGTPVETINGTDRKLLIYRRFYQATPSTYAPSDYSTLTVVSILVGLDDRVIAKHYSFHKIDTRYGAGSVSLGGRLNEETMANVRPGKTTRQEAERMLGEPIAESFALDGQLVVDWVYADAKFIGVPQEKRFRVWFDSNDIAVATKLFDNK